MTETPLQFGPQSTLIGILTQPAREGAPPVAFLTFNAGVISRIGPHRMNVKLARALARAGQTTLRFDLAGQGDSKRALTDGDFRAQAVQDIRSAMGCLEQAHGIRRFALIGVCSGAVNAFAAALADPRVAGVLLFDGHWYRSRWTMAVRHWKRFRATSWASTSAALLRRLVGRSVGPAAAPLFDGEAEPANPPRDDFARSVQALVDRRVVTLFMYSGSVLDYYSYANQFRDVFGREAFFDKVRCEFRPDIDHTFVSLDVQRRMIDSVCAWAAEVCGAADPAA